MFNIMRGGIFADGYQIERDDLIAFMRTCATARCSPPGGWFPSCPTGSILRRPLRAGRPQRHSPDLIRLCYEYLPLTFSRRHGDPSRPWNHFSINLKHADGSPRLDYQGNWRDIFQNWEPLLLRLSRLS
jgi:hypothetical protein